MCKGLINRQYVGARYVPKIMGEWDKSLQYEALCIVTYKGNSFTSKIPVPANIDIGNTDYWVNTANYNAQITEYENIVKSYKTEVDLLTAHDAIIISDSYGVEGVVGNNSWVNGLKNAIINKYNSTVYTSTHGSRGFVGNNIVAENFLDSLKEFDYLSTENKNKIKYIIVCGGANDSNKSADTIFNSMETFVQYVNNNYPNASCYVGMIAYSSHSPENMYYNSLPAYKKISELPKGVYLNGSENIVRQNMLQGDGLHPNNKGCEELIKYLTNAFFTGSCNVNRQNEITLEPSGIATSYDELGSITETQIDGVTTLTLRSNSYNSTTSINVSKSTFNSIDSIEIGTLSGLSTYYNNVAHGLFNGKCYFRGGEYNAPIEGSNMAFSAYVGNGNRLYFKPWGNATSSNFWGTPITDVKKIEISDITLAVGSSYFLI